jgi:SAM-dependent methyltransferase
MSYTIYLWDALSAVEWSQAAWRLEGKTVSAEACDGEMIRDVLLRHLPREGLIVDAGCGTAKWPIYLRRRGYRCVGLEIHPQACHMARELDTGLPMACADTQRAPVRSGSVDVVLSFGVVEHDPVGPVPALRELRRMLKPGGLLVVAVPFNNLFRRLIVNRLQSRVTRRRRAADMKLGFAEYRFSRREMRDFLRSAGFRVEAEYANDLLPPKIMGLWVDADNLIFNPLADPRPKDLFILRGWRGRLARVALRVAPWLVCGEVVLVARPA